MKDTPLFEFLIEQTCFLWKIKLTKGIPYGRFNIGIIYLNFNFA